MENSKSKKAGGVKAFPNRRNYQLLFSNPDGLSKKKCLIGVGFLVVAVFAIGLGIYLNKDAGGTLNNFDLLFSNPNGGLTEKEKGLVGVGFFTLLAIFTTVICTYLNKEAGESSNPQRLSIPDGLTKKEKCLEMCLVVFLVVFLVVCVGFFMLAVFARSVDFYLANDG